MEKSVLGQLYANWMFIKKSSDAVISLCWPSMKNIDKKKLVGLTIHI